MTYLKLALFTQNLPQKTNHHFHRHATDNETQSPQNDAFFLVMEITEQPSPTKCCSCNTRKSPSVCAGCSVVPNQPETQRYAGAKEKMIAPFSPLTFRIGQFLEERSQGQTSPRHHCHHALTFFGSVLFVQEACFQGHQKHVAPLALDQRPALMRSVSNQR